jgi:hypothetical protein
VCQVEKVTVNGELERMWNEAIVAYFKVQSQHMPGGTEEITKSVTRTRPRFEPGTSPTRSRRSNHYDATSGIYSVDWEKNRT